MFGWSYVVDYCIASFRKEGEQKTAQLYMAECLRTISEGVAKMTGGKYIARSLVDILDDKPKKPERTAEEIIQSIKDKMNG